jgi:hypothetical protein
VTIRILSWNIHAGDGKRVTGILDLAIGNT